MDRSIASRRIKRITLNAGERFALLVDKSDLPDPYVTRYAAIYLRSKGGSVNSMVKALYAIALVHDWASARSIDMTKRLEDVELFTQEETQDLVDWLRRSRATTTTRRAVNFRKTSSRDEATPIVQPATHFVRVLDVRNYVAWRCETAIHRIPNGEGHYKDAAQRLADWKDMFKRNVRSGPSKERYGLTREQRKRFLEVIHPDSDENPFDSAHRHRNYALLLLYYELGLRRAEPLALKTSDLQFSGNKPILHVHRRPDDPEDPRHEQPLIKTAARSLPVGQQLYRAIEDWLVYHRSDRARYPGAKKVPYVFVAENGRPLALRSVYDLFVRIRAKFPELPVNLSPHILRHDANDRFSELCDEVQRKEKLRATEKHIADAMEIQIRNYLMGWKKHSTQAVKYMHRTIETKATEYSLRLQDRVTHDET